MAIVIVCIVKIWKNFPFVAVTLLAGLQSISSDLIEAARIDGASRWETFIRIKIPLLSPVSAVCGILLIIRSFNDFDIIYMLTNGGPLGNTTNMMLLAYNYAFTKNQLGMSTAMAIVALIIVSGFSLVMMHYQKQED